MTELKPCPFCGGEAELRDFGDKRNPYIFCDGPCSFVMDGDTVEEAIEAWNTRAEKTCEYDYFQGAKEAHWGSAVECQGYHVLKCGHRVPGDYFERPNHCCVCGAKVVE